MSCPVVRTIDELYGSYDYSDDETSEPAADGSKSPTVKGAHQHYSFRDGNCTIYIPSGTVGGGAESTDINMNSMQFYITMRKLQFARAELIEQQSVQSVPSPQYDITSAITTTLPTLPAHPTQLPTTSSQLAFLHSKSKLEQSQPSVYFERMFKDYYGKNSREILEKIFDEPSKKIYIVLTRAVDLIDIMESVCIGALARDFPSGMSLPTIYFDPAAIENVESQPDAIYAEVNKIIDYANKLCIAGIKTHIESLPKFEKKLKEFVFTVPTVVSTANTPTDINASLQHSTLAAVYAPLLDQDMDIAEYARDLEYYHCSAIGKLNDVMSLCQSIIDLAAK